MPSATPTTTTRSPSDASATSPSVDGAPEHSPDKVADDGRPHRGRNAPLADLAQRAAAAVTDALDRLLTLQMELRSVVDIVAHRPWSDDERQHYQAVARQEREARRRSVAARDWFDDVRARLYEDET
jgi:hypothetical protein